MNSLKVINDSLLIAGKKQTREESCLWSTQCLYFYICEIIITTGQLMCRRLAMICAPFALINTKKRRWSMVVTTRCGWCSFLLVVGRWSLLNTSDSDRYGAAKLRGNAQTSGFDILFLGRKSSSYFPDYGLSHTWTVIKMLLYSLFGVASDQLIAVN